MGNELAVYGYGDISKMADAVCKSGLFGIQKPEQAVALMLIAQAEGMHPALAARDYHIIQGRPSLKADAMLARFQSLGGRVRWVSYTDKECEAEFSHPQGGDVTIKWDMARVKQAGLDNKDNYKKWPRQMLRARCISEGVRTVYPGVSVGIYTPEEVRDMDEPKQQQPEKKYPVETKSEVVDEKHVAPVEKEPVVMSPLDIIQDYQARAKKVGLEMLLELNSVIDVWCQGRSKELADCSSAELKDCVDTIEKYYADKKKAGK